MARNYRAENLRRRYGITDADYQRQLTLQANECAICRTTLGDKALHVDHNHETGQLRGLLCNHCNLGLGHFRDSPDRLAAAIAYLHKGVVNQLPPGVSLAHAIRYDNQVRIASLQGGPSHADHPPAPGF